MAGAGRATCRIIGPIDKEPDTRETATGYKIGTLIIRCDNGYKTANGEWSPKIQEIPVTLFGRSLERMRDLRLGIGDLVDVVGKISGREYKGRHYSEVIVDDVMLLDTATGGTRTEYGTFKGDGTFPKVDMPDMPDMTKPIPKKDEDDDLPF